MQTPWDSFWIQGWPLLYKFFQDQPMSSSFSEIDRPLASLINFKSRKFHWVIHQSVTMYCHPSMVHVIGPKALYVLVVQNSQSFKRKDRGKSLDQYFSWLIKCLMAPLLSLQNCQVTKSNKTYTLREYPKRFAKR